MRKFIKKLFGINEIKKECEHDWQYIGRKIHGVNIIHVYKCSKCKESGESF